MISRALLAAILIGLLSLAKAGLYGPNSKVITTITKENFASEVINSNELWLIEFYASWCKHCKGFAPLYEKVAENLQGLVQVAAIDVDEEKELAGFFGIQSIPTIKLIHPRSTVSPDGKWKPAVLDYDGERSAAALAKFALEAIPNYVQSVKEDNIEKFFTTSRNRPKVLLFTNRPRTSDLYKSLASRYFGRADFGEVKNTEQALADKFGVSSYPTLLLFPLGDNGVVSRDPVVYENELKAAALNDFIATYVSKQEPSTDTPVEPQQPEVIEVTDDSVLQEKCVSKGGLCFITFLDPEDDEHNQYMEKLQQVAEKHYKSFKVFWVNGREQNNLREALGVSDMLPGGAVYSPGRGLYVTYRGGFDVDAISEFLEGVLVGRGGRVVKLEKLPPLEKHKDEL